MSNRYLGEPTPTQEVLNTASMHMCTRSASRFGDWKLSQERLRTMDATAGQSCADGSRAEANISNIAQRSVLQTPVVVVCLVGVRNQDLIAENVRSHSFSLNADDPNAIDKVVAKRKGLQGERRYI